MAASNWWPKDYYGTSIHFTPLPPMEGRGQHIRPLPLCDSYPLSKQIKKSFGYIIAYSYALRITSLCERPQLTTIGKIDGMQICK